ncbi:MAG: HNH endonuclease [Gemmatales bacterium]
MPTPTFNPNIDRFDRRSAARIFQSLWPVETTVKAVAANLAASIQTAHEVSDACWSVTLKPHMIRLNVGQVETMTFTKREARFLFCSPLELDGNHSFEIDVSDDPFYPAVAVASGVCFGPTEELGRLPDEIRKAHDAYIQAAASSKRVSPCKSSFSPAVLECIEILLGAPLPRPSYFTPGLVSQRIEPLPEEVDTSQKIIEGAKYQITVNVYERDPLARQLCIEKHGTNCAICGFSFGAVYGPVAVGFVHVHHLRPLSEIGEEYEINPIEDLRPVCPNCHAVLHRRVPAYSIEEVQVFIRQQSNLGKAFGGWADSEGLDEFMEWNRQQRKQSRPEITDYSSP